MPYDAAWDPIVLALCDTSTSTFLKNRLAQYLKEVELDLVAIVAGSLTDLIAFVARSLFDNRTLPKFFSIRSKITDILALALATSWALASGGLFFND